MPAQFCIFVRAKNVRILKSLDCFSGKGKAKQMDILKKILSNAEIVNIKYPEKVFTISFISQYFAFNVCSLAKLTKCSCLAYVCLFFVYFAVIVFGCLFFNSIHLGNVF